MWKLKFPCKFQPDAGSPSADLIPFSGSKGVPDLPVSFTNWPLLPKAPIAPRSWKPMKKRRRGSVSFRGSPVSKSNWAKMPFPVMASPRREAYKRVAVVEK